MLDPYCDVYRVLMASGISLHRLCWKGLVVFGAGRYFGGLVNVGSGDQLSMRSRDRCSRVRRRRCIHLHGRSGAVAILRLELQGTWLCWEGEGGRNSVVLRVDLCFDLRCYFVWRSIVNLLRVWGRGRSRARLPGSVSSCAFHVLALHPSLHKSQAASLVASRTYPVPFESLETVPSYP